MKKFFHYSIILVLLASCGAIRNVSNPGSDSKLSVNLILINDVYEIAPLSGGKEGGMARVATLKKQYQQLNPNTFLLVAGDFLSPSLYNSLMYEGKAIRGRQMVEAMNAAGVDMVTFGNHEFDIRENELQARIDESAFQWISSNVFHKTGNKISAFGTSGGSTIPKTHILDLKDADGTEARIAVIGLCLPFNRAEYVHYDDALSVAKNLYEQLKDSVDAVVALTHQTMEEDKRLAREIPGLALILGGHEHDQRFEKEGKVYITKAMANAKSAYVVELTINKKKNRTKALPKLEIINERISLDSVTNQVVQKWSAVAEKSFALSGFQANRIVMEKGEDLDGREAYIRTRPTNLSRLIVASLQAAHPLAQVSLFNSGSIRVDDILHMPLTEYDILRTLPFGGGIKEVDMKGGLLTRVLDQSEKNIGSGGFLIYNEELSKASGNWQIKNELIDPDKNYRVVMPEFLLTGKEVNLQFLNEGNPAITRIYETATAGSFTRDIRHVLIQYLAKK